MKSLTKKIKYFLLGLLVLGLIGALLIYGFCEPYFIDVEPQVAAIPSLSNAWVGQRIAVIGDWQVGMWLANTPNREPNCFSTSVPSPFHNDYHYYLNMYS
ncbi:hypothetical protein [Nostoc sp.]|uniref:hypothetical protein n=1 Tax=Nostoc sp. TaxID=1180 RepID=UPI002FF9E861